MSQDPHDYRGADHPRDGGRSSYGARESYHPLEEILRLIDRESPEPWYPREFLRRSGADPDQLSSLLEYLALEKLIERVPGRSLESGQGMVLTEQGREVIRDPLLMDRLRRGEALREGDTGAAIRQGMRTRVTPYATYILIAVNVAIYLLVNPDKNRKAFLEWTANMGAIESGQWWRLMTCAFLHWNFLHIGSNMFSLYNVGSFVEQAWGRWRYLLIYIISGWTGSCLGMAFHERGAELAGASGAVCGVLGAIGVWFLLYGRHIPADFARSGLWQVVISIVLIAVMGLMIKNISNWGHLGGGIGGALTALALHIQRFGIGEMKAPVIRWTIAGILLLALPVASYIQMQKAWAGRELAARGKGKKQIDEDDDRIVEKKEKEKPAKIPAKPEDMGESGAFYRNYGQELKKTARSVHGLFREMPRSPAAIKDDEEAAQQAIQLLQEDRKTLAKSQEELEEKSYKDAYVEQARKEAVSLTRVTIKLIDASIAHLKAPTKAGQDDLVKQFDRFVDRANDFNKRLKPME